MWDLSKWIWKKLLFWMWDLELEFYNLGCVGWLFCLNVNCWWLWFNLKLLIFMQAKEQLQLSNGFSAGPVLPKFEVKDLESLDGKYDMVVCLDVLTSLPAQQGWRDDCASCLSAKIHYSQSKVDGTSTGGFGRRRWIYYGLRGLVAVKVASCLWILSNPFINYDISIRFEHAMVISRFIFH